MSCLGGISLPGPGHHIELIRKSRIVDVSKLELDALATFQWTLDFLISPLDIKWSLPWWPELRSLGWLSPPGNIIEPLNNYWGRQYWACFPIQLSICSKWNMQCFLQHTIKNSTNWASPGACKYRSCLQVLYPIHKAYCAKLIQSQN